MAAKVHAVLPIYFPTSSNFLGNIELTIGDLSDPADTTTLTTPDITAQFSLVSLLDNLGIVVDGLDQGRLRNCRGLWTYACSAAGSPCSVASSRMPSSSNRFGPTCSSQLHEELDGLGSKTLDAVRQALFDGRRTPPGVDVLADTTGDNQVTIDDVGVTTTNDQVQFNLELAQTLASINVPLAFDLGLPAVGLEVDGGAQLQLGYQFGVNRQDLYIDRSTPNELVVQVAASLPNAAAPPAIWGRSNCRPWTIRRPSAFDATFAVDFVDPFDASNKRNADRNGKQRASRSQLGRSGLLPRPGRCQSGLDAGLWSRRDVPLDSRHVFAGL